MLNKYVWDRNDYPTFKWILEMSQERYKEWKYQCHRRYQEGGPENMPEDFIGREDQWDWLCNHYESPKFKRLSEANKRNHSEKTMHHHTGSCPIIYTMEKLRKQGEVLPVIKGFEKAYVRPGVEILFRSRLRLIFSRSSHSCFPNSDMDILGPANGCLPPKRARLKNNVFVSGWDRRDRKDEIIVDEEFMGALQRAHRSRCYQLQGAS